MNRTEKPATTRFWFEDELVDNSLQTYFAYVQA